MAGTKKKKGILLGPAVGYSLGILFGLFRKNKIPLRYYPRVLAITLINLINSPFRTYERLFINPRFNKTDIEKDPVFIIGHWRSGTTHLHNILSLDPQMAYVSTYQSVFPDTLFVKAGRFIFENAVRLLIPGTRKGDSVTMGTSLPQEEEFALGARTAVCFYYVWLFPHRLKQYYNSFVRFEGIDHKDLENWKKDYFLLIKKGIKNTGRERILIKNPTNTARIRVLLEMFPQAKFIHIHRNPLEVFLSTRHFCEEMIKPLQLQEVTKNEIEESVIDTYKNLMHDFIAQKDLIPAENFFELSFDDLENQPMAILEKIYAHLDLGMTEALKKKFEHYIDATKTYTKNKHRITAAEYDRILHEWDFMMSRYHYNSPDTIEIKDV